MNSIVFTLVAQKVKCISLFEWPVSEESMASPSYCHTTLCGLQEDKTMLRLNERSTNQLPPEYLRFLSLFLSLAVSFPTIDSSQIAHLSVISYIRMFCKANLRLFSYDITHPHSLDKTEAQLLR